jgi:hypothetical protein
LQHFYKYFCVGATFEMRTVLYGIHLLIDKLEMVDRFFLSKIESEEESQDSSETERESVCERQSIAENKG